MVKEGIQKCRYDTQLLSLEQPFSSTATTESEAELENVAATAGKKWCPK